MIPAISMMVGAYIITRMVELMAKPDTQRVVKWMAIVTIIVTVASVADIAFSSVPGPALR